jgi:hypothetical protein
VSRRYHYSASAGACRQETLCCSIVIFGAAPELPSLVELIIVSFRFIHIWVGGTPHKSPYKMYTCLPSTGRRVITVSKESHIEQAFPEIQPKREIHMEREKHRKRDAERLRERERVDAAMNAKTAHYDQLRCITG